MTHMTQAEKETFLADLHVGVVSLARDGAGPLTVPIWYDYTAGGELWMLTGPESRKGKLMDVGTHISLCAQTEDAPYRYVSVEGAITSIEPATSAEGLAMAIRYLGDEMGRAYSESSDGGSVTVRMTPENWLAVDYNKR